MFFSFVESTFLGTALTLHSSALNCGDGWRWVVALGSAITRTILLLESCETLKKNLANTPQTVMWDLRTAAHPL